MRLDEDVNVEVAIAAATDAGFTATAYAHAGTIVHTFRDIDLDFPRNLFAACAITVRARILDNLACTMTASASRLIDHAAKRRIGHGLASARTITVRAGFRAGARRCARAMAVVTLFRAGNIQLSFFAKGRFFKGDFQIITQVAAAFRTGTAAGAAATAAEEHIEDIPEAFSTAAKTTKATAEAAKTTGSATAHAILEGIMAELVIGCFFLRVFQDIIGLVDLFELFFSSFRVVTVQVGMIFAGHFFISLFDFGFRGTFTNAQHLIIIAFFAHVAPSLKTIGSHTAPNNPSKQMIISYRL